MTKQGARHVELILILAIIWTGSMFIFRGLDNSVKIFGVTTIVSCIVLVWEYRPSIVLEVMKNCYKYRWGLALIVFLGCVLLSISGSSIGVYDEIFCTQIEQSEATIFGKPRWIRSDEYGVQTPLFLSQEYNKYEIYSNRMGLSDTNMVLDYYAPVWDLAAIGKPLMWGYLLFGSQYGLSWYWCGMIILLFMTAFEMLLILTGKCCWVSFLGSVMIVLAPAIQWWVMPHMPIVILYAMGLYCVGYYFFTARTTTAKWIFATLSCISVLGFALSVFPSFQIPCAYIVAILLAVSLFRDRNKITFQSREWYRIAVPIIIVLGILGNFLCNSYDDIQLLMNTVYPGDRTCVGGDASLRDLFTDMTSLYLPYRDVGYLNNCEVSTYIHFAPFFIAIFPRIFTYFKREKSSELLIGVALTVLVIATAFYMCVGIPEFLAKITLLKYCNRMKGVYGWIATIYSIWGMYVLIKHPSILKKYEKIIYPLVYGIVWLILCDNNTRNYFQEFGRVDRVNIGIVLLIVEVVAFILLLLAMNFGRTKILACGIATIMAVAGIGVNPVEIGIGAVTDHPISKFIKEISGEEPDQTWLCTDCIFLISNFAMANGARVLSATNFYPDTNKWDIIDPSNDCEEITNRYANQSVSLVEGEHNLVELVQADSIRYAITPETLKLLEIDYLLSTVDYTQMLDKYGIKCVQLMNQEGYGVYELTY